MVSRYKRVFWASVTPSGEPLPSSTDNLATDSKKAAKRPSITVNFSPLLGGIISGNVSLQFYDHPLNRRADSKLKRSESRRSS